MKNKYLLIVLLLQTAIYSQTIKIRESFQSEDSKPEPALVAYSKSKDKGESYLVDVAIGYSFASSSRRTTSIFGEYHRNTLIDEEQNTIQGGLAFEYFSNNSYAADDTFANSRTWVINATGKYSKNEIDTIHSLQFTLEVTQLLTHRGRRILIPNDYQRVGNAFSYIYSPALGIENEYIIDAPDNELEGNIFRGVCKLFVGIKPLPSLLDARVELYALMGERYDLLKDQKGERQHFIIDTGANLILLENGGKSVKVGFSYNKGDNPAEGLKEQEYYIVSLKIKI